MQWTSIEIFDNTLRTERGETRFAACNMFPHIARRYDVALQLTRKQPNRSAYHDYDKGCSNKRPSQAVAALLVLATRRLLDKAIAVLFSTPRPWQQDRHAPCRLYLRSGPPWTSTMRGRPMYDCQMKITMLNFLKKKKNVCGFELAS